VVSLRKERKQVSAEAERSILGAILLDNAAYKATTEHLKTSDFSLDSHRRIYLRMSGLSDSSRTIDLITLAEELRRHGDLEKIGGPAYITGLLDGVPDRPRIEHYVGIVREASYRRLMAKQIEQAQRAISDPSIPTSAFAEMSTGLAQVSAGEALAPRFSEDALALRFSQKHADDLKYVHRWGIWLRWDGTRWTEDSTLHTFDLARTICREASAECGDSEKATAVRLASKGTSAAATGRV
jgi:hypothetical protein